MASMVVYPNPADTTDTADPGRAAPADAADAADVANGTLAQRLLVKPTETRLTTHKLVVRDPVRATSPAPRVLRSYTSTLSADLLPPFCRTRFRRVQNNAMPWCFSSTVCCDSVSHLTPPLCLNDNQSPSNQDWAPPPFAWWKFLLFVLFLCIAGALIPPCLVLGLCTVPPPPPSPPAPPPAPPPPPARITTLLAIPMLPSGQSLTSGSGTNTTIGALVSAVDTSRTSAAAGGSAVSWNVTGMSVNSVVTLDGVSGVSGAGVAALQGEVRSELSVSLGVPSADVTATVTSAPAADPTVMAVSVRVREADFTEGVRVAVAVNASAPAFIRAATTALGGQSVTPSAGVSGGQSLCVIMAASVDASPSAAQSVQSQLATDLTAGVSSGAVNSTLSASGIQVSGSQTVASDSCTRVVILVR